VADQRDPVPVAKAVEDCHQLIAWILPQLDKLPRSRRYTLGSRLEDCLLDILEALLAASWQRERSDALQTANRRLAVAKHLWRLMLESRAIAPRS